MYSRSLSHFACRTVLPFEEAAGGSVVKTARSDSFEMIYRTAK